VLDKRMADDINAHDFSTFLVIVFHFNGE
jgi:hypothetical protein